MARWHSLFRLDDTYTTLARHGKGAEIADLGPCHAARESPCPIPKPTVLANSYCDANRPHRLGCPILRLQGSESLQLKLQNVRPWQLEQDGKLHRCVAEVTARAKRKLGDGCGYATGVALSSCDHARMWPS